MEDKKAVFVLSLRCSSFSPVCCSPAWVAGAPVGRFSGASWVFPGSSVPCVLFRWSASSSGWAFAPVLAGAPLGVPPVFGASCVVLSGGLPWVLGFGVSGWFLVGRCSLARLAAASPAFASFCGRRGASAAEAAAFLSVAVS